MDNNRKKSLGKSGQAGLGVLMGAVSIVLGLTAIIPKFGAVGIIFTLAAVIVTVVSLTVLIGCYIKPESITEEEGGEGAEKPVSPPPAPVDETEVRLKKLQTLHQQSLISDAEYEEKRKEILKDL